MNLGDIKGNEPIESITKSEEILNKINFEILSKLQTIQTQLDILIKLMSKP